MIKKILPISLFLSNMLFAECEIESGSYESFGGTEYSSYLTLLSDKKVILKHENWLIGDHQNKKVEKITGDWSCEDSNLFVELEGVRYKAELKEVGVNPVGIDQNSIAIYFDGASHNILKNQIFYKEQCLE